MTELYALVIGSADCVWDDLDRVPTGWPDLVLAVNMAGATYPGIIDHWCSLHPEKFPGWISTRRALGHPGGYTRWAGKRVKGVDHGPVDRVIEHDGGTSAGLAIKVALHLGATQVVLAGCPQTNTPHFHDPRRWAHSDACWPEWVRLHADGKLDRVRSLSGRTRDLLGGPDW